MRRFLRLTFVVANVVVALTNSRVANAQQRLPSADPSHQVDHNTKDYDVPAEVVFKALEAQYRAAGIKPTMLNPASYQISYIAIPAGPKVGSAKIENVVNCGGDKKAPLAKTVPLSITVRSVVTPRGDLSTLKTFIEASPISELADSASVPTCVSSYSLEQRLAPRIKLAFKVVRVGRE